MADLVVTFSKAASRTAVGTRSPKYMLAQGSGVRTEALAIGATSVSSTLEAVGNEHFVELLTEAACWVAIGANPTAEAVSSAGSPPTGTSRKLLAGARYEFSVLPGDKVAVIEAV